MSGQLLSIHIKQLLKIMERIKSNHQQDWQASLMLRLKLAQYQCEMRNNVKIDKLENEFYSFCLEHGVNLQ